MVVPIDKWGFGELEIENLELGMVVQILRICLIWMTKMTIPDVI